MVLKDGLIHEVEVDDQGRLCRLLLDGQEWRPVEPGTGWSLGVEIDGQPRRLRAAAGVAAAVEARSGALRLGFSRLCLDEGETIAGGVRVEWRLADGLLQGRLEVDGLPPAMRVVEMVMPDLAFAWHDPRQTALVVPVGMGHVLHEAAIGLFKATETVTFGTPEYQCFGWLEGSRGLYLDTRDSAGWVKSWRFSRVDGRALRVEAVCAAPGDAVGGRGMALPYWVSIGACTGHWYDIACRYRRWALEQPWAARGPAERRGSFFGEIAGWLWNRGAIERVVPPTLELARRLGVPLALDWYWWHRHGYDTEYPDYFPPRQGTAAFKAAVKALQAADVRVQVYTNGMTCDQDGDSWEPVGPKAAVVKPDGSFKSFAFNVFTKHRLAYMCGAAEAWRDLYVGVADQAHDLGLDGLYIDMIGNAGGYEACYATDHGHTPGGGCYGMQGFRKLFERVRERHPEWPLSTESTQEMYLDLAEGSIILCTSGERFGRERLYGCRCEAVPLFSAIYHGHCVCFGNYALVDGVPPYDDLWPAEHRPNPAAERDWPALCPDQFAYELGRTLTSGCQPMACNLTAAHLADPARKPDIAFLIDVFRFYHRYREHLLWGHMLPPGEMRCSETLVRFMQRFIFTPASEVRLVDLPRPQVLHSSWVSPSGQALLVLVNPTRQPAPLGFHPAPGWRAVPSTADGLRVEGGWLRGCLAPRSLTAVVLAPG